MNRIWIAVLAVFALAGIGVAYGALNESPCDSLYHSILNSVGYNYYNWPSDVNNDRIVNMADLKAAAPYIITHDEQWCAIRMNWKTTSNPSACVSFNRSMNRSITNGMYSAKFDVNSDCKVDFEDQVLAAPYLQANDAVWCKWRDDIHASHAGERCFTG